MFKRLFQILCILPIMVVSSAHAVTCQSNEFEYNGECIENKFQITTTNNTNKFVFNMSAKGTFYIDWGDGNVQMINRTGTTMTEYTHNYASANEYIIKFGGRATGYNTGTLTSAICFGIPATDDSGGSANASTNNTASNIAAISGTLGEIFPIIGSGGTTSTVPLFFSTFRRCTNLTTIPADLFGRIDNGQYVGLNGKPRANMFRNTFGYCTGLTGTNIDDPDQSGYKFAIPDTLFGRYIDGVYYGVKGGFNTGMFRSLFAGCTNMTGTIPKNLFAGVTGAPSQAGFYMTFYNCSKLNGQIPEDLFGREINGEYVGLTETAGQDTFYSMFYGCSSLAGPIPEKLFGRTINGVTYGIKETASGGKTFSNTFNGCSGLTGTDIDDPNNPGQKYAIHPNLFSSLSTPPRLELFNSTFYNCSGLTGTIPGTLFAGISGKPAQYMFYSTFQGCSGLTGSIPANLFNGISGAPANSMFYRTFYGCSGLMGTDIDDPNNPGMKYAIPPTLFSGISGAPATNMFLGTFHNCSELAGTIPGTLFSGIFGTPIPCMFQELFRNDVALTGSIPGTLFSGISGKPARSMFNSTFSGCQNLTGTIPSNLFSGISGAPASQMFYYTFLHCKKITGSIPGDLFSGIIGHTTTDAFVGTFSGCNNLGKEIIGGTSAYYVPPELFVGIDKTSVTSGMMTGIFQNTGLLTACPTGTTQYITGFESYWNNKKSCTQCSAEYPLYDSTNDTCYAQVTFIDSDNNTLLKKEDVYYDGNNGSGYNLPSYSPVKPDTVIDNWKNGSGTVIAANDVLTGNQVVYSDWGFHCDSGHYFHVGNEQICAAETKRTEHAMVIQFDPEHTYYIHATPNSEHDYTINSSSIHKMKANYNGTIYNLHDASVYFDN